MLNSRFKRAVLCPYVKIVIRAPLDLFFSFKLLLFLNKCEAFIVSRDFAKKFLAL